MIHATQSQLANYLTNTGCAGQYKSKETVGWKPHMPYCQVRIIEAVKMGYPIRIALTPYGLPSHLDPHNPEGLTPEQITEGGLYRAVTKTEADAAQAGKQLWDNDHWFTPELIWRGDGLTFRLPASTPFPDWAEMSKAKEDVTWIKAPQKAEDFVFKAPTSQPVPGETPETIRYMDGNGMRWHKLSEITEGGSALYLLAATSCDGIGVMVRWSRLPDGSYDVSVMSSEGEGWEAANFEDEDAEIPRTPPTIWDDIMFSQDVVTLERQRNQAIREIAAPGELFEWLEQKLEEAKKALRCREQAEKTWRGGTDESWAKVARFAGGKALKEKERLKIAESQKRISVKCRREVEMFEAVITALSP